jgi:uncharacterized heparinase superfamily protein
MQTTSHAYAQPAEAEEVETERVVDLPEALGGAWVSRSGPRDTIQDALAQSTTRAAAALIDLVAGSAPYRWSLKGPLPDPSIIAALDPRPGRVALANQLFTGVWSFAGATLRTGGSSPWRAPPPSEAFAEELHGFGWLRHFRAAPGETSQALARALVTGWIERFGRYHGIAWRPEVTARRIQSWLSNGRLIWDGADVIWRCQVTQHVAEQARHLARTADLTPEGAPRIATAVGLALSGFCLSEGGARAQKGLERLAQELDHQLLPDGGHVSRNPATLLQIFADLVALQATIESARQPAPEFLRNALDRIAPMIRMLRHGDGRLALFNGGDEGAEGFIDGLLARAGQSGAALAHARHSSYHRLEAGKTIVIADTGAVPRGGASAEIHGGTLAFEMSVGAHRVVVNCGPAAGRGTEWRAAARATAAHSTLSVDDQPTIHLAEKGVFATLLPGRVASGPRQVKSAAGDSEQGRWLWSTHDAYVDAFQLIHERRLFLDGQGRDLRGEDRLSPDPRLSARSEAAPFAIRFHLHPDVRASLARDGRSVLILLPNGEGWRFRVAGGTVALESSIYLGRGDLVRKSEQIVVSGETNPGAEPQALVKWAFQSLAQSKPVPAPPPAAAE